MKTIRVDPGEFVLQLGRQEVEQRIVRVDRRARFFPAPDLLFDLWHEGRAWGAKLREEPHWARKERVRLLECGELTAGLRWRVGAELRFRLEAGGERPRIVVEGDLDP